MRLIDGDALADVLTAISGIKVDTGRSEEWAVTVNAARQAIAQMPTIEPKKGKWQETDDGWDGIYYVCSECGCPWTLIDGTPYDNGMNYCPNCGARMENGDDSN